MHRLLENGRHHGGATGGSFGAASADPAWPANEITGGPRPPQVAPRACHFRNRRTSTGLCRVVATLGALETLGRARQSAAEFVERHARGDVCEEERRRNDEALIDGSRLLSAWICTSFGTARVIGLLSPTPMTTVAWRRFSAARTSTRSSNTCWGHGSKSLRRGSPQLAGRRAKTRRSCLNKSHFAGIRSFRIFAL